MEKILDARVRQKKDTLENWNNNPLVLLDGEQAFVVDENGQPINFKIGDGARTFAELPFWIQYDQGQYVAVTDFVLPTPSVPVAYTIVREGTYSRSGQSNVVVPLGHLGILSFTSNVWYLNGVIDVRGRGILSILKTNTVGLVDTYTITYTDSTTSTFQVTNGTNAQSFNFKGNVTTYVNLPSSGNVQNDAWYNLGDELLYVYNGSSFPNEGDGISLGRDGGLQWGENESDTTDEIVYIGVTTGSQQGGFRWTDQGGQNVYIGANHIIANNGQSTGFYGVFPSTEDTPRFIPVSVNGQYADDYGNITVPTGGSSKMIIHQNIYSNNIATHPNWPFVLTYSAGEEANITVGIRRKTGSGQIRGIMSNSASVGYDSEESPLAFQFMAHRNFNIGNLGTANSPLPMEDGDGNPPYGESMNISFVDYSVTPRLYYTITSRILQSGDTVITIEVDELPPQEGA